MRCLPVISLILLVIAGGCSRSAKYYLDRGNKMLDEGKAGDAVIQFRKALQKDSKSSEAYYRLGLAQLRKGDIAEAFRALNQAVRYEPVTQDALVKLADLNLASYLSDPHHSRRFYDEVERLSQELLKNNPRSVQGLRLKGALALVDRKPSEAINFYREANEIDPSQPDVVEGFVQALFQTNHIVEGEQLAKSFLEKNKRAAPIYDVLYARYLASNELDKAENVLLNKISNNPSDSSYRLQLALFYVRTNRPAQMDAVLQYLLAHQQEFPQAYLQVGDFYNSIGKHEEAVRQFEEASRANSKDHILYQKRIAATLLSESKTSEALSVVDRILKEQPKDVEARATRADLLLGSADQGQRRQALIILKDLVKDQPDDVVLRFKLGLAHLQNGNAREAMAELEESARRGPAYIAPRLALAEIKMSQHEPQQALQKTEEVLAIDPSQPRARFLHAAALVAADRQTDAMRELNELQKDFPQSPEVPMQLGLLAIRQKRFGDAEQIFRKVQQTGSFDSALAAAGLAETFTAEKEFDKSITLLEGELEKSHNSAVIGNLLAFTAMRAGNYDVAIKAYRMLLEKEQSPSLYSSLGQAYFLKGDYTQAVTALERARKLGEEDGRIEMLLAAALGKTGHGAEMKAQFEHVLQLQPNNPAALNNMAYFLCENGGDLDKALELAQRAVQIGGNDPSFVDTLGWVYSKKNMHDSALQIFNQLIDKQPDNPTFRYHLGVALYRKGDDTGARVALRAALSKGPSREEEQKIRETLAKLN